MNRWLLSQSLLLKSYIIFICEVCLHLSWCPLKAARTPTWGNLSEEEGLNNKSKWKRMARQNICKYRHMCSSHIIPKSKLFLVQIQLELADLQNHRGSRGSRYGKIISGAQWWILSNKIVLPWGTSCDVVFKAENLAYLSANFLMDYLF